MRPATHRTSLDLITESEVRCTRKTAERRARSRKSSAKVAQNSQNLGAPRAEKLPEIGQHTLRDPKKRHFILWKSRKCVQMRKSAPLASMSRKFSAEVTRKKLKFFKKIGNPARGAQKSAWIQAASAAHIQRNVVGVDRVDIA